MINEKRRLIDANELYLGKFPNAGMSDYKNGWNDALDAATTQAPPVDAVEVVRGAPVPHYETWCNSDGKPIVAHQIGWECPFCGDPDIKTYCPNCGAKMDGERKDNDD